MSLTPTRVQTAVVQIIPKEEIPFSLPLAVRNELPVPRLPGPDHVLVRVVAVALNPTDVKMVTNYPLPGNMTGCDFCGFVEGVPEYVPGSTEAQGPLVQPSSTASAAVHAPGTRVCGAVFP